jgi:hypothetical protein
LNEAAVMLRAIGAVVRHGVVSPSACVAPLTGACTDDAPSLATLQRHLKALRDRSLLEGTVRTSASLRNRRHKGMEYPVFRIPDHVVNEVSRWCDPDFWPAQERPQNEVYNGPDTASCKPQNEVYDPDERVADEIAGSGEIPVTVGISLVNGNKELFPLINRNREEGREKVVLRENRRLRRRSTPMKRQNDDYDPPVIGADPDRKREPEQRQRPTTAAEQLFDAAWQRMFANSPALKMRLPLHPWASGTKAAFRGWLKNQFLPEIDADLERAGRIFDAFCADLVSGREFVPGEQPPYRRLQMRLDRYATMCPPATTPERARELEERQQDLAEKFRPAAQNRRVGKAPKPSRVESQFFLD